MKLEKLFRSFQKQLFDRPSWTPPSRDYMNKAVTCQICKESINDVESVLLCDACEKGYHLKCIQFNNQKGIPRGEWHCAKCLMLSNGKPLPPKYGRVMRNMSAPKMSSNTRADQLSLCKRVGSLDEKVGQQKVAVNGIHGLQSVSTVTMGDSHNNSANSNMPNMRDQSTNVSPVKEIKDVKSFSGTCRDDVSKTSECASVSPAGSVGEGVGDVKLVSETEGPQPAKLPETVADTLDQSETFHNRQDTDLSEEPNNTEIPPEPHDDKKLIGNDLEKTSKGEISNCNSDGKPDEQRVAQANIVETSGTGNQALENLWSSSDNLHTVDWIGDVLQVVDEKRYYQSCCINGIVYKLQDHTLVRFASNKLMPSKLQAMWEDSKSTLKWITVSQCYFPEDLPDVVGRPCAPEPNEVYESNHVTTMMAGLVQGACEVLPPTKFVEENGSGHSGTSSNDGLRPVFLCKWFFDESKGVFRDVSS